MQTRMWMLDLAREQSPTLDHMRRYLQVTRESGYTAIGLYLEHRFAYPSAPWAAGEGCLDRGRIETLESEFPDVSIVPFVNLLGHFEGMIYTEEGKVHRESLLQGMQACPSNPDFVRLAERMVDDAVDCFSSELVHIGGDETWQLGACDRCAAREKAEGRSGIYGGHFGPLARRVLERGRRPAVWGDMFLEHPEALAEMPKGTLIFDWQYFKGPRESTSWFMEKGFEVVCCPTIQTYNATWMHLPESEANVLAHASEASELGAEGVCVTTWEMGLFGSYDTVLPAVAASGRILAEGAGDGAFLAAYLQQGERFEEWARLMGVELQEAGGPFEPDGHRNRLRSRLLLYSNPFLAWIHHGEDLCGEPGSRALDAIASAHAVAPDEATQGICLMAKGAIEFVRLAGGARDEYAAGRTDGAIGMLGLTRKLFDDLESVARRTYDRIGGSLADIERCRIAKEHVERVIARIRRYGDGSLGYLPSFEVLTHPKFVPHDQACWWLINRWGNE